jgi:hypothetical protein
VRSRLTRYVGISVLLHAALAAAVVLLVIVARTVAPREEEAAAGPAVIEKRTNGAREDRNPAAFPGGRAAEQPAPAPGAVGTGAAVRLPERPVDVELFRKGE